MKLQRFIGKSVHGIRDFDVEFKTDLTFLTGINGTGKTTVLNAIVALISPLMPTLADLDYEIIRIEFEQDRRENFVEAIKNGRLITLRSSGAESPFEFSRFLMDQEVPASREAEFEQEYYRDTLMRGSDHPVLKFIAGLPTPMFLGLDRRARFNEDQVRGRSWPIKTRLARNVFSPSLSLSLLDAANLAETRYREILLEAARAGDDLRREMLLRLLVMQPARGFGPITAPTKSDLDAIKAMRRDVAMLPQMLSLRPDEVNSKIIPFLDSLDDYARAIPKDTRVETVLRDRGPEDPVFQAVLGWSVNIPQLARIKFISDLVSTYNNTVAKIREPATRYQELVNKFLGDSGKTIGFDSNGYLSYSINGVSQGKPISSLSSGEAQIFVILAHLSFNPYAQRANVFIIDEPELSLHIQWQELFVASILSANPNIQYIMATHSPSIILDKVENCIDMGKDVQRDRRRG